MHSKKWKILQNTSPESLDEIKRIIFENRGITKKNQIKDFLKPRHPDKIELKETGLDQRQLKKGVERVKQAVKEGEHIVVYGDYDVDGISATAILWETLYNLTPNVMPYIPNRFTDGYGLNAKSVEKILKNEKISLIITVDNGIVAQDAISVCRKRDVDVIVTDHHQKGEKLKDAFAIIHSTKVCGAVVSYFFAKHIALETKTGIDNKLELVALGSVADQMPLVGINRNFVWHGIKKMHKTKRVGLRALIEECRIQGPISVSDINFRIAPRLNAAGRLGDGLDALRLLCTTKKSKAQIYARKLEKLNQARQSVLSEVLQIANGKLEEKKNLLVVAHDKLHEGVIGLAASKMVETFYLPSVVISIEGDMAKGSARSIKGFSIVEAIRQVGDLIVSGGGHEMAAGFSIKTKNIEPFRKKIKEYAATMLSDEILSGGIRIDSKLEFSLINWELIQFLKKLEPCGIGNPQAIFASYGVEISGIRSVGKEGKHLKFEASFKGETFDCIAFNFDKISPQDLFSAGKANLVYKLEENQWQDRKRIQLNIKDIKIQ